MTTTEELVEDRLMGAAEALNLSSAGRVGPAVAVLRRRRRRRQGVGAMVLSLAVLGGGFLASRPSDSGNVTTDLAEADQSVTQDDTTANTADKIQGDREALVERLSIHDLTLRTDSALWPVEALTLDELLGTFADDVLNWPGATWSEPTEVATHEGMFVVSAQKADDSEAFLSFVLEQREQNWVIAGTGRSLHLKLEDGNLVGVRLNYTFEVEGPTTWIDIHLAESGVSGSTGRPVDDDVAEEIDFPAGFGGRGSITPADVGAVLVIGRDEDMAATFVQGIALGFPDRLTLNLDSLGPGQSLGEIDTVWARSDSWRPDDVGPLDLDHVYFYEDAQPGFDVYLVPLLDHSGICYWLVNDQAAASSCTGSIRFNKYGASVEMGSEERSATLVVVPDGVEIGDIGDAGTVASGNVFITSGSLAERPQIVDGVLTLK